eukprot:CAMPEP_0194224644 /NCGR_PEP_ID=MMETSP0156-20130528/37972_1 /TAXON_ID=33649 /ORGANISM="Thalassionema nitzschioides, Strain L26-B" /LENGTH=404 /DNA_ID=CAMNT_0038956313 /DNA_START=235 /DNA_END=1446 /DNA_ORIENTATION=+
MVKTKHSTANRRRLLQLSLLVLPYVTVSFSVAPQRRAVYSVLHLRRENSDTSMMESTRRSRRWGVKFPRLIRRQETKHHYDDHTVVQMTDAGVAIADPGLNTIMNNFERFNPHDMLPDYDTMQKEPAINKAKKINRKGTKERKKERCTWLEQRLENMIHNWSAEKPEFMKVRVWPKARPVTGQLVHEDDVDISIDKAVFEPIQFSKLKLQGKRVKTNLLNIPFPEHINRHPKQFDCHFEDLAFSEEDLIKSSSIRDGLLRDNFRRILERNPVLGDHITIDSIDSIKVLPGNKLACSGHAGGRPFTVQSRIEHSSRGHKISFNDIEISSSLIPILPEILSKTIKSQDIDLGANTQLRCINLDADQKILSLSAKVTITPDRTLKLNNYYQPTESFSSNLYFDVGRW